MSRPSEPHASEPAGNVRPLGSPGAAAPAICPHCWHVNPGPFRLCARCGASMETVLQESGGLRRTAPVQSPVPVARPRSLAQRVVLALLLAFMVISVLVRALPVARAPGAPRGAPAPAGH